ncbi:MAG: type I-U CRISPR-associated protein Cas8c [Phycisphaerae bacterium]|nr:MAG: type I-U CRISPR-associated protein Cas8c [Phycisphaerae bacterium]
MSQANITIPVDLTNPGQFFACCGLLELADRLWPGAEGWFDHDSFHLNAPDAACDLILQTISESEITNTLTPEQIARREEFSKLESKDLTAAQKSEKGHLDKLHRELPIVLKGQVSFCIDWFRDKYSGGSRLKTWAGQQSILTITQAMHKGIRVAGINSGNELWKSVYDIGLPFYFDSDLGGQGSGIDIGFVFDALASNKAGQIKVSCKPALEMLCFIGLQRFRPFNLQELNRFVYVAWNIPLSPSIASAAVNRSVPMTGAVFEFSLLYRTDYLKSFLPAQPYKGDRDE